MTGNVHCDFPVLIYSIFPEKLDERIAHACKFQKAIAFEEKTLKFK